MKRLRIDRIDLHLRNVPGATAKDAADLLGTALAGAFGSRTVSADSAADVDAGHLAIGAAPSARALASGIAQRIAAKTSKG